MEAKAIALRELILQGVPGFPGVVELIEELCDEGRPNGCGFRGAQA